MALRKERGLSMVEIITGVERRRRYFDAERAAVLAQCDAPGATIVGVSKQLQISPNLIHSWRRLRREAEKLAGEPLQFIDYGAVPDQAGGAVAAAGITSASSRFAATASEDLVRPYPGARPGGIDIDLPSGAQLSVDSYVNEKALARVLRVLRDIS